MARFTYGMHADRQGERVCGEMLAIWTDLNCYEATLNNLSLPWSDFNSFGTDFSANKNNQKTWKNKEIKL